MSQAYLLAMLIEEKEETRKQTKKRRKTNNLCNFYRKTSVYRTLCKKPVLCQRLAKLFPGDLLFGVS